MEERHVDAVRLPDDTHGRLKDVVSIAAARVAARELVLAVVPALQGAAQGARDGAGSAPDVQDLAAGAVL